MFGIKGTMSYMEKAGERESGFGHRPRVFDLLGGGGMPEEEARGLAHRLVQRARGEGGTHEPEAAAPSPHEVRRRRESRRKRRV